MLLGWVWHELSGLFQMLVGAFGLWWKPFFTFSGSMHWCALWIDSYLYSAWHFWIRVAFFHHHKSWCLDLCDLGGRNGNGGAFFSLCPGVGVCLFIYFYASFLAYRADVHYTGQILMDRHLQSSFTLTEHSKCFLLQTSFTSPKIMRLGWLRTYTEHLIHLIMTYRLSVDHE